MLEASALVSMQGLAITNSDSLLASGIMTGSSGDQRALMLVLAFTTVLMPNQAKQQFSDINI